ncbi:MAG: restriction endonuclease subunit S [Proteobacteria bacterium]|nr:restriction endonuclease subunit S [Pseudomonadota bacterium]MBU1714505.1 restriction endonuclease subunit S [Pseudomonadota bacterium]
MTSSITVKHLSSKTISEIPLPLPPTEQQKRIVAEIEKQFSRLDEAVANLKRVKANLKRYKAAVLKAAVEGKLTEEWRKQHLDVEPASKLLKRILAERRQKWEEAELTKMKAKGKIPNDDKWKKKYKEPKGPELIGLPAMPEAWGWATLPQLGELNRGKSKHRPRNDPKLYGGPYPFVQTGDIRHANGIITEYSQTYSEEGLKQSRLWPVGTLCITIAANIADTALLGFEACFPDSIVGFIPETEQIDTKYVEYFIRTAKEDLDRFAPATAQKNINLAILSEVAIPVMSLEEQMLIVQEVESRLSVADRIDKTIEITLRRNEGLRQTILSKAFSGELVGPSPGDELAHDLLEKIKSQRKIAKASIPTIIRGSRVMAEKDYYFTLEEVDDDHLSKILTKNVGDMDPKHLWQQSNLTIDDFYAQLKREVDGKLIEETPEKQLKLIV